MRRTYQTKLGHSIIGFLFRYPFLMLAVSGLLIVLSHGTQDRYTHLSRWVLGALLIIGIAVKILQLVMYRYKFGSIDNLLMHLSVPALVTEIILLPRRFVVQKFIRLFLGTFATLTIAYSALYYSFAKGWIGGNYLVNLDDSSPLLIQTLYFSTATISTVGFGDIHPHGSFLQLLCISEMLVSFCLIIIFITAFSATTSLANDLQ